MRWLQQFEIFEKLRYFATFFEIEPKLCTLLITFQNLTISFMFK